MRTLSDWDIFDKETFRFLGEIKAVNKGFAELKWAASHGTDCITALPKGEEPTRPVRKDIDG